MPGVGRGERNARSASSERLAWAANLKPCARRQKVGSRAGALREYRGAGLLVSPRSRAPLHRLEPPPLHGSPGPVMAPPALYLRPLLGCSLGPTAPAECVGSTALGPECLGRTPELSTYCDPGQVTTFPSFLPKMGIVSALTLPYL